VADKSPDFIAKLFPFLGSTASEFEKEWIDGLKDVLEETRAKLAEKFGEDNVETAFREGDPKDIVLEEVELSLADLLIIGDVGTKVAGESLFGTLTDVLVTNAPSSVSVLRRVSPDAMVKELENEQPIEEDKYLIPLDDTEHSAHMIEKVLERPWPDNAKFKLLHVIQPFDTGRLKRFSKVNPKELSEAIADILIEKHVALFKERYPNADVAGDIVVGHPREVVLKLAAEWPADHIILGSRRIKGLRNEIKMGAISKSILFHSRCSVEIVR
ncbi:MAG TPA: universal stress protein, partial [Candidatus Melainabacteria bacterium]|nr:universal stress protein [Candidatus Melainabacteria bacterium]